MGDLGTIPSQNSLNEIKMGLRTQRGSIAREICGRPRRAPRHTSGKVAYYNISSRLVREEEPLAPGAPMKEDNYQIATTDFQCKRYYGRSRITDEEKIDLSYYDEDLVEDESLFCVVQAEARLDLKLASVMADTALNQEFSATGDGNGAWDTSAGTPIQDLLDTRRTLVPGADLVVIGEDVHDALLTNPNIRAESANYDAGSLDYSGLQIYLARKLGMQPSQIYIFKKDYNSAKEGQPAVKARGFGTGVWMGYRDTLLLVEPDDGANGNSDSLKMQRNDVTSSDDITYYLLADIVRPDINNGATITDTITP